MKKNSSQQFSIEPKIGQILSFLLHSFFARNSLNDTDKAKNLLKSILFSDLRAFFNQFSSMEQPATSESIVCILEETKNRAIIDLLKENPTLIPKIDPGCITCFSPMGAFRIYLIAETYLLYEDEELIFSSRCWAVVHRNQKEWHYYREKEKSNPKTINEAFLSAPD
jgi:hypothetical protein